MHGESTRGSQTGSKNNAMTKTPKILFFLGAPDNETKIQNALLELDYEIKKFTSFEDFMKALLSAPPWGVLLWDTLKEADLEAAIEVLRHHFRARECITVLINAEGGKSRHSKGGIHMASGAEQSTEQILQVLKECEAVGINPGNEIPRILIVDDDENIVLLGAHIVSSMGMIPLVAFDGNQAVDKARRFLPDLVLLDLNMPTKDGFEVIRQLKADSSTNLLPIIVFSARKRDEDKVKALGMGADDYVTKPFSITELSARIDRLLARTRAGVSASATTGLPGSISVEQILVQGLRKNEPLAVLYVDADNFKAFNDRYGFTRGDSVIRQIADVVVDSVREKGNPNDFVGHIGGDDFVVVTAPKQSEYVAREIIEKFERIIPFYYDAKDRSKKYIEVEDRKGKETVFPLMSLSIAIVTNETRQFHHPGEVADVAAQLKAYAKSQPGSFWVKDQRTNVL